MMMNLILRRGKLLAFMVMMLVTLYSCTREIKYLKTESGLEYYYIEQSDTGKKGKPGYFYLVDMIGQREDDSVFVDSYKLGQSIKLVRTQPPFHSLFNDALGMLKIGDSIIFRMPADSFFKPINQSVPAYLKPGENIRFTMKVKDILDPEAHLLKMYIYELDKMVDYVKQKKWNFLTDKETGIKYEIIKKGNSVMAKEGDEVEIWYLLTTLDGKIIDKIKAGDKVKVLVGSDQYISGLSRLLMLADEGSKVHAVIPFSQAFGENSNARVEAYTTLVIEMDVLKINKK